MAGRAALHRTAHARKAWSSASATPPRRPRRFATRCAPARRFRRISATARHATLPEIPNYIWDAARRRSSGRQLHRRRHPSRPRLLPRRAACERNRAVSILITDAVMPAMCAPGHYDLGETRGGAKGRWPSSAARRNASGGIQSAHGSRHRKRDADRRSVTDRNDCDGDDKSGARRANSFATKIVESRRARGPRAIQLC